MDAGDSVRSNADTLKRLDPLREVKVQLQDVLGGIWQTPPMQR